MFKEYVGIRVLTLFLENPFKEFYLREVARNLNIGSNSAKKFIDLFLKKKIIKKTKKGNLHILKLDTENAFVRQIKIALTLYKIKEYALVEKISKELGASSIVLFGSSARGEDDKNSDLDILTIAKKKKEINLEKYEKKLKRTINLLIYSPNEWEKKAKENKPFYEKIVYEAIVLVGETPVIK